MKTAIHFAAIVALTLFFASAFTTLGVDQHPSKISTSQEQNDPGIAQVIIIGKPLTLLEKAQYYVSTVAQMSARPLQDKVHVASK